MRIIFIGTGAIGVPVLRFLFQSEAHELVGVVTQPDKAVGRAQRVEPTAIKAALGTSEIPIFQPPKIRAAAAVEALAALTPEVIVVMAYGQILPRAVLEIPRIACLNLHASLLPRHRGAAPIQAAIVAGDAESGVTVMYMDAGLDTGDVLSESRLALAPEETGGTLHDRLAAIAPPALEHALDQLARGTAPRTAQDAVLATYAPKLEREQGRIDWGESAELIARKVRAYDPWPGTFTAVLDDRGRAQKLKIFRAHVVPRANEARCVFAAADAGLAVTEAQIEGKRRMSVEELLRGHPWLAAPRLA